MSLFDEIQTSLRSTGFVTNGQASDLAEKVVGDIHIRERSLHAQIKALQDSLNGLQALVNTAKEGTEAMDSDEYCARALATFEAICAPGLFQPEETESVEPASPPTARLVVERYGDEVRAAYSDFPVDIVFVNRGQHSDPDAEPESLAECFALGGEGRISDIERYFEDAEVARQAGKLSGVVLPHP
ncbi:hypothetical protein [Pseudomonas mosselii]|uniref:hypothetical protein n=1 Tax=Pseudomonas mosselii TaxID=78327 RepID=UPI0021D81961|nr:hypothetical protein [Pseudomonas mosselii]MCU9527562.1 hypothetical protein [Pseudomonas mosselii]MCU9534875.1 hypothetical protein [Pseudomonas mosselii]MCU9542378.1 hypothetical protein [Pseudomonas mosselii]MCU9546715.1 hypothetical protein [Pseudomonas mosselii]